MTINGVRAFARISPRVSRENGHKKIIPTGDYFLATIFKNWVFAFVAVFVIIVAILLSNRF